MCRTLHQVKSLKDDTWQNMIYEHGETHRSIQVTGPESVILYMAGATVQVRLEDGRKTAGFANRDGRISDLDEPKFPEGKT